MYSNENEISITHATDIFSFYAIRKKIFVSASEFTTTTPDSWFGWGVHWVIKRPSVWTLNTFVKTPILWAYAKIVRNSAENLANTQPVVVCEVVRVSNIWACTI